jgi:hypothetical protein
MTAGKRKKASRLRKVTSGPSFLAVGPTRIILIAATTACLLPFVGKSFNIDDPLFVWTAKQIVRHPIDPYGFPVVWYAGPVSSFRVSRSSVFPSDSWKMDGPSRAASVIPQPRKRLSGRSIPAFYTTESRRGQARGQTERFADSSQPQRSEAWRVATVSERRIPDSPHGFSGVQIGARCSGPGGYYFHADS